MTHAALAAAMCAPEPAAGKPTHPATHGHAAHAHAPAVEMRAPTIEMARMAHDMGDGAGSSMDEMAFPIAAALFYPAFGLLLRPEIAALSISGNSLIVALNALMLRWTKLPGIRRG